MVAESVPAEDCISVSGKMTVPNVGQSAFGEARIDGAPRQKLRLLDLFSGIGGFSLGLERTGGFETARFCEVSPKCRHLLNHHWPEVPCHDDVRTFRGEDCGEVDAICGGFPCQDISLAGKGAGLAGERSGLWSHYARLVGEIRPRFVIVENVSALLVRGLGTVLGDLAALGYGAWWDCIPASAVGAPHRRDRLWIVAYAGSLEHQGFGDAFRRALAAELPQAALANANSERLEGCWIPVAAEWQPGADPLGSGSRSRWAPARQSGWWAVEPVVGRVAHGVPARVDRLHGLGNAVVPEIPYRIGRAILAAHGAPLRQDETPRSLRLNQNEAA